MLEGCLRLPCRIQPLRRHRKRKAAQFRSEGEGKKAEILGQMEKEPKSITSEAFKTAEEIRGKADAEATKIYGEAYNQDRDF